MLPLTIKKGFIMKIVQSITVFLGLALSAPTFSESVPADGYVQYQKSRIAQVMPELESYGTTVTFGENGSIRMTINKDSFKSHLSQYKRVFTELPIDAQGLRLHIYTPSTFDEASLKVLVSMIEEDFKAIYIIEKLNCTSVCDNLDFHIF